LTAYGGSTIVGTIDLTARFIPIALFAWVDIPIPAEVATTRIDILAHVLAFEAAVPVLAINARAGVGSEFQRVALFAWIDGTVSAFITTFGTNPRALIQTVQAAMVVWT